MFVPSVILIVPDTGNAAVVVTVKVVPALARSAPMTVETSEGPLGLTYPDTAISSKNGHSLVCGLNPLAVNPNSLPLIHGSGSQSTISPAGS